LALEPNFAFLDENDLTEKFPDNLPTAKYLGCLPALSVMPQHRWLCVSCVASWMVVVSEPVSIWSVFTEARWWRARDACGDELTPVNDEWIGRCYNRLPSSPVLVVVVVVVAVVDDDVGVVVGVCLYV